MSASGHEAVLDAVEQVLSGLGLNQDGNPLAIYRRTSLADVGTGANIDFPCLVYGPDGTLTSVDSDTSEEVWGYPVTVRFLARLPLEEPAFTPLLLSWREAVRDAFHREVLSVDHPGVFEVYQMLLQPSPVSEPEAAAYQLLSSRLTFSASSREVRG